MTEIKTIRFLSIIGCLLAGMAACASFRPVAPNEEGISVQKMTGFPKGEPGFLWVYRHVMPALSGRIIDCRRCNFPETPAAEGGRRNSTKVFMLLTLLQIQFSCGEKSVSCPLLLLMESQYRLLEG